ncbi:metH [Symbiodinium sp. CCMP2592]|nr:metH [Symbiodinium sp. CCMP2592]
MQGRPAPAGSRVTSEPTTAGGSTATSSSSGYTGGALYTMAKPEYQRLSVFRLCRCLRNKVDRGCVSLYGVVAVGHSDDIDSDSAMAQRRQWLAGRHSHLRFLQRVAIYGSRDVFAQFDLGQKLIGPADTSFLEKQVWCNPLTWDFVDLAYLDNTWQDSLSGRGGGGLSSRKTFL